VALTAAGPSRCPTKGDPVVLGRCVLLALVAGAVAPAGAAGAIAVEGEAQERSNIPTATARAASGARVAPALTPRWTASSANR
jgi:hypothetical protein